MRWDRNYTSSDIEDRRGDAPPSAGGPGMMGLISLGSRFGWKGIIVAIVIGGFLAVRNMGGGGTSDNAPRPAETNAQEEELKHFVGFVFDDVQKTWARQVDGYDKSTLVLFRRAVKSGCGVATEEVGPFYCPRDRKVYIDLDFYDELRQKLGAPGDFAQAYVIAHEVGHHVQNLAGLIDHGSSRPNDTIQSELQADCLAGAWAKDADARGLLEVGDVDEAINAAKQIGDDTLQKKAGRAVQPEKWTHGSSAQRTQAFHAGFDGGAAACGLKRR